ncbi:hypothetical protein SAMN02910377_00644 [Pseudobutyrivibrio ruminis]|uniref:Uncharacterized protein n=2 Tax=Pseudobutyrivibrio ruminis TaxID=46206 RepID=A0A1H7G6G2_9FIRM|nr:hypothetical protein SAMN02910377_00644 [Pseudobutyrivibrio ruminis]
MDFNGFNMSSATSAVKVAEIAAQTEELARKVGAESLRQEVREQENHDNLNSLANDSQEIITLMKRHIELLETTNEKLESNLSEVTSVLKLIFDNGEMQKDHMEQITALACQIAESLDRGEKIDWKDKAADGGVQFVVSAICMALRMRGINI